MQKTSRTALHNNGKNVSFLLYASCAEGRQVYSSPCLCTSPSASLIYGTKKLRVRADLTYSALAKLQELWQQLELQSSNWGCCYSSIFLVFPCIEVVSCWAHLLQLWPHSTTVEKTLLCFPEQELLSSDYEWRQNVWPQNERGLLGKPDPSELTAAAVGILTGRFCYGVQPRSKEKGEIKMR